MSTPNPASNQPLPEPVATPEQVEAWFVKYYRILRAEAHKRRRANDTLLTTEVADEAYLAMRARMPVVRTESEFLAALCRSEACVLLDAARKRNTAKCGGGERVVELPEDVAVPGQDPVVDYAEWRELLTDLNERLPEHYLIVSCRIDLGWSQREIAVRLRISERTVRNRLTQVRGWIEERRKKHI